MPDGMIKRVTWGAAREPLTQVRMAVFVHEQGVDAALEIDAGDPVALHVLALDEAYQPIGAGRLLPDRQIGRLAVMPDWRGRGIGTRILEELLTMAREVDMPAVWLNAQTTALPFYQRLGFMAEGDVFDEAGIPHRKMHLTL